MQLCYLLFKWWLPNLTRTSPYTCLQKFGVLQLHKDEVILHFSKYPHYIDTLCTILCIFINNYQQLLYLEEHAQH